jgi:hypothetical protein
MPRKYLPGLCQDPENFWNLMVEAQVGGVWCMPTIRAETSSMDLCLSAGWLPATVVRWIVIRTRKLGGCGQPKRSWCRQIRAKREPLRRRAKQASLQSAPQLPRIPPLARVHVALILQPIRVSPGALRGNAAEHWVTGRVQQIAARKR